MKSTRDFRNDTSTDSVRKAVKLEPIRKSGKEKHEIFKSLHGDEEEDQEYLPIPKRESILDYIDDQDEVEDEEEEDEEDEDYDDEFDDDIDDQESDEDDD